MKFCRMGLKRAFGYVEILCGKVLESGVLLILDIFSKTGCSHTTRLKCKILLEIDGDFKYKTINFYAQPAGM